MMRLKNKSSLLLLLIFFLPGMSFAQLKTARIFSSHMVLQRNIALPIWGSASSGETVRISFQGKTYQAKADKNGHWETRLNPSKESGPFNLEISTKKDKILLEDILIGDVWVCSGQSNMEWPVQMVNHADEEIAAANHPNIRLFQVSKTIKTKPASDLSEGEWTACSPKSIAEFSAVGYFFGRTLQQKYQIPIGLISTSWGGTNIETWTSGPTIIQNAEEYREAMKELDSGNLEQITQQKTAKLKAALGDLPDKELGLVDGKALWADPNLNTSDWKTMQIPQLWESAGLEGLDGFVWFRTEFELSAEQVQRGIILYLGKIDDSDMTWLNGNPVGETKNAYNQLRQYTVSSQFLHPGKNTLAVRVEDTGGGGGIWGDAKDLFVTPFGSSEKISLAGSWKYKISKAKVGDLGTSPNAYPSLLFNGMINPLIPYAIKGAIWYQGEANADKAYRYRDLFPLMIKDWRNHWKQGDFPFLWVQLANFMKPDEEPVQSAWAELREAQTMTLSLPNTGMASAIDLGVADDIHPRNKQDVGKRLALAAEKAAYGENSVYSGPQYKSMKIEGNQIRISFELFGSQLKVKDKYGYLKGFSIAGNDKKFYWAQAKLDGKDVLVYSDKVPNPVAVRYAWANNPDEANLYDTEGLPANPFRTDDWPGVTYGLK